jgi:hypothetical protein
MNNNLQKLKNHRGRFITIEVSRKKTGNQTYCAKVSKITDATVTFRDANAAGASVVVPLKNVVRVG